VPHAFGGDPWGHYSFNTKTRTINLAELLKQIFTRPHRLLTWNLALSKPKPEFDAVPHAFGGDPVGVERTIL